MLSRHKNYLVELTLGRAEQNQFGPCQDVCSASGRDVSSNIFHHLAKLLVLNLSVINRVWLHNKRLANKKITVKCIKN